MCKKVNYHGFIIMTTITNEEKVESCPKLHRSHDALFRRTSLAVLGLICK